MDTIVFVDGSKSEHVQRGLDWLCEQLRVEGIQARWCARVEEAPEGSILLVHDPVNVDKIPEGCRLLGQRCLDRRERLVLAERCGLAVPRWCALSSPDDIPALFDQWNVEYLLYKADWSYSRQGIKLLSRQSWQPFNNFNPAADVFMEILDGKPDTYKVDFFYDQPIACRHLFTRSVFDRKFYKGFTQPSRLGDIPPIEEGLKVLGKTLLHYGEGLSGADVMLDQTGRPWIIELNTSSVGREATWMRWPEAYLGAYAEGIRRWVDAGSPATYCRGMAPDAPLLDGRSGGGEQHAGLMAHESIEGDGSAYA